MVDQDGAWSGPDVQTVFEFVSRRLAGTGAPQMRFRRPPDAINACLIPSEADDSGQGVSGDTAGTTFDSITTVGELHESIARHFGSAGWTALVSFWQEAAGIQQPSCQPKTACAPIPAAEPHGKPETPLPALPSNAYPLEEGLHAALSTMNPRAVAFLLHVPRDPPGWRYVESDSERGEREFLQDQGCWTGG